MLSVRWVASSILFFVALLSFSRITEALNGAQLVGHSAVTEAMGGAGAAAGALDNSVILTNPAALRNVSPGVRLGTLVGFPRTTFNSTAAPLGNAAAGTMTSNDDPLILPSGSLVVPVGKKLVFGTGVYAIAGFGNDYPASALSPAITGNTYDLYSQFTLLKIINAVSYNLNDRISLGLAFHLNRETLASDGPTAALTETTGGGRSDASIGFGGAIGIFFKPIERLQIGASYITEQFFNEFERYQDILPRGLNYPQQVNAGLTFAPFKKLLLAADFRWINWSGARGGFGDSLVQGGLGWRDQYIGMFGIQYHPLKPLILRAGYNYGKTAVPPEALFINALSTAIAEHHLGVGVGFRFIEKLDFDISYLRGFTSTVTDNGSFNPDFAGATAEVSGHQFTTELGVRF